MDQPTDDVAAIDAFQHHLSLLLAIALTSHDDDVDEVSQSDADRVYDTGDHHTIVLLAEVDRLL